jgi:hypothetical protein
MAKLQPLRDGDIQDRTRLRVRLNEVIDALNGSAAQTASRRIANVQAGMQVVTAGPGFSVGAIVLGGVTATNGGAAPTVAPWVDNWAQQPDGKITFRVGGLGAAPSLYSVNVVFFESEATS